MGLWTVTHFKTTGSCLREYRTGAFAQGHRSVPGQL